MVARVALVRNERRSVNAAAGAVSGLWVVGFILFQFTMQLALIVPGFGPLRLLARVAGFGASLALLGLMPNRGRSLRLVRPWVVGILGILGLEVLNPGAGGALAGLAQFMLNLAIVSPIFWVPRTAMTQRTVHQLVTSFWLFYLLSAAVGVLQAYFPGHFEPPLSTILAAHGRGQVASLQIRLASGQHIFRPMGLTDAPGGAAYAALYAIVMGTGVLLLPKPPFFGARALAVGGMVVGMMCLYLCQVRSLLIMTGICVITMIGVLAASGRVSRAVGLMVAVAVVIPTSFAMALSLGGRSVTNRLSTLVESNAGTVYYTHRGRFLEQTVYEYLPRYPLGAGLGRWGMVSHYFGSTADSLYVELQWTGWVFDGGLPLVLAYCGAIGAATWVCFKVSQGKLAGSEPTLGLWAGVIVAYNVGALALCFNYALFIGSGGLEFWLLNAALITAAQNSEFGLFARAAA